MNEPNKKITEWAGEMIRSFPHNWSHDKGSTPAMFAERLLKAPTDWKAWAEKNFPGHDETGVFRHLEKEVEELRTALMNYDGSTSRAENAPEMFRDLVQRDRQAVKFEAADVAILALRIIQAVGGDPFEVLLQKWEIVSKREYVNGVRKVEPNNSSTDDREMIDRQSTDGRFFIVWNVGVGFYLASNKEDGGLRHWTTNKEFAETFEEHEARNLLDFGEVLDENGKLYAIKDVGAIILKAVTR